MTLVWNLCCRPIIVYKNWISSQILKIGLSLLYTFQIFALSRNANNKESCFSPIRTRELFIFCAHFYYLLFWFVVQSCVQLYIVLEFPYLCSGRVTVCTWVAFNAHCIRQYSIKWIQCDISCSSDYIWTRDGEPFHVVRPYWVIYKSNTASSKGRPHPRNNVKIYLQLELCCVRWL